MKTFSKFNVLLIASLFFLLPGLIWAANEFDTELASRIKTLSDSDNYQIGNQEIYGSNFVTSLYKANGNRPVWNDESIKRLYSALQNLEKDGLHLEDYWPASVSALIDEKSRSTLDIKSAVDLDILLSEFFVRAYYNLQVGKVDPEALDKNFNFPKTLETQKLLPGVVEQVIQGRIAESLDDARPGNKRHIAMKEALARYRKLQENGGWSAVQGGKTLKAGQNSHRVIQLRDRLTLTGDYKENNKESALFDADMEAAVKQFQKRHGLETDGAVGPKTLAALNIPVEQKIDQIRVNLERQRWYMHENHDEFIVTDIAGFNVYWLKNDEIFWETKAQVGKSYTQTPMFKSNLRTIEFNPTWTIPPGIMRRSVLPGLKKDPDYLDKKGFLLLTRDGKEVDPKSVDWASIKTMPYMVRQPAGPTNALGMVKFLFPNKHYVYLHDTNHREHFADARRSFSSGCVRIEKPFDFAERLLAGQGDWDRKKIDDIIASGKTTRVNLKKPVRIVIAYITVTPMDDGVYFKEDIYQRDAKVLKALDGEFRLRASDK